MAAVVGVGAVPEAVAVAKSFGPSVGGRSSS